MGLAFFRDGSEHERGVSTASPLPHSNPLTQRTGSSARELLRPSNLAACKTVLRLRGRLLAGARLLYAWQPNLHYSPRLHWLQGVPLKSAFGGRPPIAAVLTSGEEPRRRRGDSPAAGRACRIGYEVRVNLDNASAGPGCVEGTVIARWIMVRPGWMVSPAMPTFTLVGS